MVSFLELGDDDGLIPSGGHDQHAQLRSTASFTRPLPLDPKPGTAQEQRMSGADGYREFCASFWHSVPDDHIKRLTGRLRGSDGLWQPAFW